MKSGPTKLFPTVKGLFFGSVRVSELISGIKIDVNKLKMKCARCVCVCSENRFSVREILAVSCGRDAY